MQARCSLGRNRLDKVDPILLGCPALLEYEVGEFSQGEHYLEQQLEVMHQTMPGPTAEYAPSSMVLARTTLASPNGQ